MSNLLTIDLEDYFQVHAFSRVINYEDWDKFECRIERNTDSLLEILNEVADNSKFTIQNSKSNHSITHSPNNSFTQKVQGTFFVLGWIAERYPELVRRIQKEGHEIACHGHSHKLIYTQTRDEFRQDVKKAKSILENIIGGEVIGYRAPSYSITHKSQWAFEVLAEEGFKYDSSVFPIHHDFYGLPEAPRFPFIVSLNGNNNFEFSMLSCELKTTQNSKRETQSSRIAINDSKTHLLNYSSFEVLEPEHRSTAPLNNSLTHSLINPSSDDSAPQHGSTAALNNLLNQSPNNSIPNHSKLNIQNSKLNVQKSTFIIEFPISTVKVLGTNVPISGGGYFRLFSYSLIKRGLRSINQREHKPFIFYIHPWELDFEQPRIKEGSLKSRFRHYVNLDKTEVRFKKLLSDFQFSTIRQLLTQNAKFTTQNL